MSTINLMSDTVTKPTPDMLQAMFAAEVGDDVFGEDPTINALEAKMAKLFGKEAALFCPSGTMTNQIAIKVHTQPLDEVICDEYSHIYQYETGGYASNSGVGINLIRGTNGKVTADQVEAVIKPVQDWLPISKLVVLENTCNKGGGSYYTLEEIRPIRELCERRGLKLHLDGARLFNALVETDEPPRAVGELFDSVSICLSKGLGAPVGSVLIGDADFIRQARRVRKVMGGGMRQAGYLAAACIYALDHHVDRLKLDNDRARRLGEVLEKLDFVESVRPVRTNIVIFDLKPPFTADSFLAKLREKGILAVPFGPQTVRFVTHLDVTEAMIERTIEVLKHI
ncbi:threonine aldolase family protein [Flavilitoribacter nigricans]|uniref:Threonine aldolase n=1 Tax=Flavilitoribacter nigricans (strain ATCC 23147 / DSM 23189 / NBRC 102662 / NCIMB 1420 / SS-2) TaxID=1122177 RepID=A0A2D0NB18_FLAN2|nr:GntG family PLP-dependent aldolase [Flavilitoribacter nigricans]PHN04963.1 threonine aldolase [Flavilitoribacter nigricans DSM 23189 = NBRC 102662]